MLMVSRQRKVCCVVEGNGVELIHVDRLVKIVK